MRTGSVYPRWRGEHFACEIFRWQIIGLSPLARGTLSSRTPRVTRRRFIPAGAGNTISPRRIAAVMSVYPRWRGEHICVGELSGLAIGLSPLARGTPIRKNPVLPALRFIPAGAGNTRRHHFRQSGIPVYPRWRGEHKEWPNPRYDGYGLSPLARGTLTTSEAFEELDRFIPAGAGNTLPARLLRLWYAVYPRWRGEHSIWSFVKPNSDGLSPLARGTRSQEWRWNAQARFIPAGAGNTRVRRRDRSAAPVYPRWRGEHPLSSTSTDSAAGLSPLARGTRDIFEIDGQKWRFIPAGAGNTWGGESSGFCQAVYPRWRGEHGYLMWRKRNCVGLSPLARGTRNTRERDYRR